VILATGEWHVNKPAFLQQEQLRSVLELRREAIVHALAKALFLRLQSRGIGSSGNQRSDSWIVIESLSQLRGLVGGRFQNLKQRWVAAGFPLRAHRGDRTLEAQRDEMGWSELQSWLVAQGFEARISTDRPEACFEIRLIDGAEESFDG
jgi:hypothetical protein